MKRITAIFVPALLVACTPEPGAEAAGHRLRLTVMGADRDNAEEVSEDPPAVRVYRSAAHPSRVELPVAEGPAPG
ncbi:hypothetical protein [Candidatus Palauibacter sp.]|uniref:hypothetical protein n=1 Tax=Candidatus Palauibacter sp. TaxID=3101350 RepID=UPI003B01DA3C